MSLRPYPDTTRHAASILNTALVDLAARRPTPIITASEERPKRTSSVLYGRQPDRVHVVYEAGGGRRQGVHARGDARSDVSQQVGADRPDDLILVCTIEPRKEPETLTRPLTRSGERENCTSMVGVGTYGWLVAPWHRTSRSSGTTSRSDPSSRATCVRRFCGPSYSSAEMS